MVRENGSEVSAAFVKIGLKLANLETNELVRCSIGCQRLLSLSPSFLLHLSLDVINIETQASFIATTLLAPKLKLLPVSPECTET